MRPSIHGGVRVRVILSEGVGFHPKHEGERQRKTLRGNVITEEIVQVNMKVLEKPKKEKAEKPKKEKKAKTEVAAEKKEAETESKPKEDQSGQIGKTESASE